MSEKKGWSQHLNHLLFRTTEEKQGTSVKRLKTIFILNNFFLLLTLIFVFLQFTNESYQTNKLLLSLDILFIIAIIGGNALIQDGHKNRAFLVIQAAMVIRMFHLVYFDFHSSSLSLLNFRQFLLFSFFGFIYWALFSEGRKQIYFFILTSFVFLTVYFIGVSYYDPQYIKAIQLSELIRSISINVLIFAGMAFSSLFIQRFNKIMFLEKDREIQETRSRYLHLFQEIDQGFALLGMENELSSYTGKAKVIDVNRTLRALYGNTKEELLQKDLHQLLLPFAESEEELRECLSENPGSDRLLNWTRRQKKSGRWFQVVVYRVEYDVYFLFVDDVHLEVEKTQREQEQLQFLKKTVEAIPNPVFFVDNLQTIQLANQAFLQFFDLVPSQILNQNISDLREDIKLLVQDCLQTRMEKGDSFEISYIQPNNNFQRHFLVQSAKLAYHPGIYVITDISRRIDNEKRLNTELESQRKSISRARKIHKKISTSSLPLLSDYNIQNLFQPSELLGGDFVDIQYFKNSDLCVVLIADCTGHGLEASLYATLLKSVCDRHIAIFSKGPFTNEFLSRVNKDMALYSTDDQVPSLFCLSLDTRNAKIYYSNANGELPYVVRQNQLYPLRAVSGFYIGYQADCDFDQRQFDLLPGDRLLLFTDALIDPIRRHWNNNVNNYLTSLFTRLPNDSLEALQMLYERHRVNHEQKSRDDLSLVVIDYNRPFVLQADVNKFDEQVELILLEARTKGYQKSEREDLASGIKKVYALFGPPEVLEYEMDYKFFKMDFYISEESLKQVDNILDSLSAELAQETSLVLSFKDDKIMLTLTKKASQPVELSPPVY